MLRHLRLRLGSGSQRRRRLCAMSFSTLSRTTWATLAMYTVSWFPRVIVRSCTLNLFGETRTLV